MDAKRADEMLDLLRSINGHMAKLDTNISDLIKLAKEEKAEADKWAADQAKKASHVV